MPIGITHHRISGSSGGGATTISNGYVSDMAFTDLTLTQTPAEVKVGAEILANRKAIYVINDSSKVVNVADYSSWVPGVNAVLTIFSGEIIEIEVDPEAETPFRLWAGVEEGTTTVRIIEVN